MKVAMVLALIAICVFALGGAALASTGLNGPTPPAVGDPVGTNVSPHGGFSSSTNYCLQCHSVHSAPGGGSRGYALQATVSVTATCNTCHGLFGAANVSAPAPMPKTASGSIDSNARVPGATGSMGTASSRTAYDLTGNAALNASHDLGETSPPAPDGGIKMYEAGWGYGGFNPGRWVEDVSSAGTSSQVAGGLYCGSCHTPHGDFGQAVNTKYFRSDAGTGANEVQIVYLLHPQPGFQFYLTYGAVSTATLTYGAGLQLAQIQAALETIPALTGNVTVTNNGSSATCSATGCTNVKVTFGGSLALTDVSQITATAVTPATGEAETGVLVSGGAAGSLEAVYKWQNDQLIYSGATIMYLYNVAGTWSKCTGLGGTGTCTALTQADAEGQTSYLYGYKLLQGYPNHNWDNVESWGMAQRARDAARWCGACHPSKVSSEFGTAFTQHNHPTDCTYCHGNPNDQTVVAKDYPHTSTVGKFLKAYPDGICVTCHSNGSLV